MRLPERLTTRMNDHLAVLYGSAHGAEVWSAMHERLQAFHQQHPELVAESADERLTERDVILITYGDQIQSSDRPPLQNLAEVLTATVEGRISGVHILPFYPYSSDDGFSVIDYTQVDSDLGSWEDVTRLGENFRLMFDLVLNHISAQSRWFKAFLEGDPDFANAFIVVEPGTDLSMVTRPRARPLLTAVTTASGEERLVWTTFSEDQIDLNFTEPTVLLLMLDVLLFYVAQGAEIIRLDAIAYLWKRVGTSCIHLEETHRVVKLFRAALDAVAPGVMLITETNVPHAENISYFGDGSDEAQLVYQFPLPPLVFHAILSGDATYLTRWASSLAPPSPHTTFYNFLASHDGIGVRPVEDLLPPGEVAAMAAQVRAHGGYVSYKANADGSQSAYELNISYFDALSDPSGDDPLDTQVARFMVSQAIMLSLQGIPAIYVHSLFGSRNDREGVKQTGRYRSINRGRFRRAELEASLEDPMSLPSKVFKAYGQLLDIRTSQSAFHPSSGQIVLDPDPTIFALCRTAPQGDEWLLCLHNVSNAPVDLMLDLTTLLGSGPAAWHDLLSSARHTVEEGQLRLTIAPYAVLWLHG